MAFSGSNRIRDIGAMISTGDLKLIPHYNFGCARGNRLIALQPVERAVLARRRRHASVGRSVGERAAGLTFLAFGSARSGAAPGPRLMGDPAGQCHRPRVDHELVFAQATCASACPGEVDAGSPTRTCANV
jgi:hypothetical protein